MGSMIAGMVCPRGSHYRQVGVDIMDITVSEPVADMFYKLCMGTHNGQMAVVPNDPIMFELCRSHRIDNKDAFIRFLRQIADQLELDQPF